MTTSGSATRADPEFAAVMAELRALGEEAGRLGSLLGANKPLDKEVVNRLRWVLKHTKRSADRRICSDSRRTYVRQKARQLVETLQSLAQANDLVRVDAARQPSSTPRDVVEVAIKQNSPDPSPVFGADLTHNAVVGSRAISKSRMDAIIRWILVRPVVNGDLTPAECAAAWRNLFSGKPDGVGLFKYVAIPENAFIKYADIGEASLRRWRSKILKARAHAKACGLNPPLPEDVLLHTQPHDRVSNRKRTQVSDDLVRSAFKNNPNWSAYNVHIALGQTTGYSLRTTQRVIAEMPDSERAEARGGIASGDVLFAVRLIRENAKYPNAVWQMDHSFLRQDRVLSKFTDECKDFDFECDFRYARWNKHFKREWVRASGLHLSVILDEFSRKALQIKVWPKAPNTLDTMSVVYLAAKKYGLCELFYTDNGGDLTSDEIESALRQAGIQHLYSLPYTPEGRGKIEAFFRMIKSRVMPLIPGYRGGVHDEAEPIENLYTLEKIEELIRECVELYYNSIVHSETGRTPNELYDEAIGARGFHAISQPDRILSLLPVHEVKRRTEGVVVGNRRYYCDELSIVAVGTPVRVHMLPYNTDEVYLSFADLDGNYHGLCPASAYGDGGVIPQPAWELRKQQKAWRRARDVEKREHLQLAAADRAVSEAARDAKLLATATAEQLRAEIASANAAHPVALLPTTLTVVEHALPIVNPFLD